MRATKLYATGDIRMVDVDVPSQAKNEILIKVEAAGICGTDRHLYHGEFPPVPDKILGHEFSGIVVDSGEADIAEGARVVILGIISQGEQVPIEPFDMLFREIQMHFSFLNSFTHERAAKIIADGTINVSPLVSRIISLEETALAIASPPPKGEVRAIVVPNHD